MGVSSTLGISEEARVRELRIGSFDPLDPGVIELTDLWALGVALAYGLGVVKVRGLKLWPVSTSDVFVELFQRGRFTPSCEPGLVIWLGWIGVLELELMVGAVSRE